MPEKSEIKGRVMVKLSDGSYVEIPKEISLEEAETMAEQYEFVRVVRCKDCIYWDGTYCADFCTTDPDGYCSWGERRKDGQEMQ